jgi:hypothetical protein
MGRIAFEGQIYHDISLHSIVGIAVNKPEEPVRNQDFDDHLEVSQNRGPQVTMGFNTKPWSNDLDIHMIIYLDPSSNYPEKLYFTPESNSQR